jgi:hypothetical protein
MKKAILFFVIVLALFGIGTLKAQNGYYTYHELAMHYSIHTVLPTVDGGALIAVVNELFPDEVDDAPAKIFKLSDQLEETARMQLSDDGVYSYVIEIYNDPSNDKLYYAIGKKKDLECQCEKPYLVHFDYNLNILSQTVIDLPDECRYLTEASTLLADDGCIYWVSSYETEFPNMFEVVSHQIYMKINLDGELENFVLDNGFQGSSCFSGDIFPYLDGTGDFGHLYSTQNYFGTHNTLIRFTRNLEISLVYENDGTTLFTEPYGNLTYSLESPCNYQSTLTLPDGKLLYTDMTSEIFYDNNYFDVQHCSPIFKIDLEQFQIQQYQIIGRDNDSTEKVPAKHAIDYVRPNELFHCCCQFQGMDYLYSLPKKILVTKIDDNLHVTWQKQFLFDGQHYPVGVKASEDGGCWVYGLIRQANEERAGFVFKLNAEGLLNLSESMENPHPYAFFPNPVKDKLQLCFFTDFRPFQVEFYDLQGRLVCTQSNTFEAIDMSQLPTGTYMLRVTLEDGKVFSDKVIKK